MFIYLTSALEQHCVRPLQLHWYEQLLRAYDRIGDIAG
jgi:hypothetical protein